MGTNAISAINSNQLIASFDFLEVQEANMLFQTYGDQFLPTFQILRSMGRETMVSSSIWEAFEDNYIVETITAAAGSTSGATTITVRLSATDVDANGYSYPRVGDLLLFPDDKIGWVEAKTVAANTDLTVRSVDNTNLTTVAGTTVISVLSGAFADGTDMPAAATRGVTKRTFYTQIFKERVGSEGGALADAVRCTVYENDGSISGYYSTAIMDCDYRLAQKIDGAFWAGLPYTAAALITQTGASGLANPVYTTEGLFPAATRGLSLAHGGTFTLANFDTIGAYLVGQRVTSPYILAINGLTLDNYIQNLLYNSNLNTGVDFTTMVNSVFGGNQGMAMSINFNTYRKGQYTYLFKVNTNFSNPKVFAPSAQYEWPERGVWMPLSKLKDPKNGDVQNNVEVKYKGLGAYSRRFLVYTISGAGEVPQVLSTVDATNTYEQAEMGLQIMKTNQLIALSRT